MSDTISNLSDDPKYGGAEAASAADVEKGGQGGDHHTVPTEIYFEEHNDFCTATLADESDKPSPAQKRNYVLICLCCAAFQVFVLVLGAGSYILWYDRNHQRKSSHSPVQDGNEFIIDDRLSDVLIRYNSTPNYELQDNSTNVTTLSPDHHDDNIFNISTTTRPIMVNETITTSISKRPISLDTPP